MANVDQDPAAPPGLPTEQTPAGPGSVGGPPAGGGANIAAIARQRQGPQVSAPGPGNMADSMNMLLQAIGMIQQALPGLQAGSALHRDALNALSRVSRHLPQGAPTAGVQQTNLRDLLRRVTQNAMFQRILGQQGQQGTPQQGAGDDNPAGPVPQMMAQAPMPSTPLPGA